MKYIKEQANYTPNLQVEPHDLSDIKWTFPEFGIVSKRYIFLTRLTRQFNRRW
jgi:hypothetical protein